MSDKPQVAEWMYATVKKPLVTEKTAQVQEGNWFAFEVALESRKPDIRKAVEALFSVDVLRVNTLIQKGKTKGFQGTAGKRSDVKKAFVKVKDGQTIDAFTA